MSGLLQPGRRYKKSFLEYLAPHIESYEQVEVDFIVAHEVAHAHLGHAAYVNNGASIEDEADALVEQWGFTIPARRREA